ncbi:hypothetical protein HPB52_007015 [Rhipicephalus sanguineus]|uniref:RING-type E3 ubiquitin transferase n=1 Tax=Rhipicephalus sanguineus TaxID=34632 RepID=A0A9D4QHY7_RHISA|nr:hypothetical protein HPB52_007015 [Rhipicephalus sanguineus]
MSSGAISATFECDLYTVWEAATSLQRFELYETDLWAVPRLADYREASPEFYSAHPSRTRRLIPWLTRELNALMQHNRGRVLAALDKVLWLIWNFDIRHPTFFQNLEDFFHEYTEHFVHEFYLFASSVFETMDDYDRGTEYASRLTACSGPNPVDWFRRTLRESEQACALAARAAPVADTNDSPQPGPSILAVSREVEITSSNYTTREVATRIERFELYERDLWAVPRLADNREASPEFYSAHPSSTRRLIPWLTRELNALMQHNRGRVLAALDKVLWLIWNFDIRHPTFSQSLEDFFHEYTEHFVHEFYLFASSVFETMDDYDRGTEYASRLTACSGPNPVDWFRRTLRESEQACALAARAAPVADTNDSPQPGPSSLALSREVEITSSNCTTREAATSIERFELYKRDLWAAPRLADNREASPEVYSAHPSRTRRLIPWLTRELNALMQHNRDRVLAALDKVLWLIWNFDIRHPTFSQSLEDFFHEYTEHFVHEFYLFASSAFETMDDYDRGTEYASRLTACSGPNPVDWFRRTLRESEQESALAAPAAPVADTNDSPQPCPSGLAVSREVETTSSMQGDSDSDSSDCIVVKVRKPLHERTRDVIEILSSEEDDVSDHEHRQAPPCDRSLELSNSSWPSDYRSPLNSPASSDSFWSVENAQ